MKTMRGHAFQGAGTPLGLGRGAVLPVLAVSALLLALTVALSGCSTTKGRTRVAAGDTTLHLEWRGLRSADTLILFLHGGPGSGLSSLLSFKAYPGELLQKRFLVAYLHQRGILRSPAVPEETQTIAAHVADLDYVVRELRGRFPGHRLVLMGHSWGGILALSYGAHHPQAPVDGLVLVSTPVYMAGNEQAGYDRALAWAREGGRRRALQLLEALGPPPYDTLDEMMLQRRMTGRAMPRPPPASIERLLEASDGMALIDPAWRMAELNISRAMFAELMAADLRSELPRLQWPLLVMVGELDATVMADRTVADLEGYGGPKRVVRFAAGDHQMYMQDTARFVAEVEAFVGQLTR
jgi:pimeloyl-ACP methyl ester carboxylesterase